jgi:hypothetical protein
MAEKRRYSTGVEKQKTIVVLLKGEVNSPTEIWKILAHLLFYRTEPNWAVQPSKKNKNCDVQRGEGWDIFDRRG